MISALTTLFRVRLIVSRVWYEDDSYTVLLAHALLQYICFVPIP